MKLSTLTFIAAMTFSSAALADDACTAESLQSKVTEATMAMQTIAAKDPARMQELALEMQAKTTEMQSGGDLTAVCAFYDEVIAEAAN